MVWSLKFGLFVCFYTPLFIITYKQLSKSVIFTNLIFYINDDVLYLALYNF